MSTQHRSRILIVLSACLLLASGCSGGSGPDSQASATASAPAVGTPDSTTAPTAVSTPAAADPTAQAGLEQGDLAADLLEAVPVGEAVALDDGLVVSVGEMSATEVTAAPGEVGGPGVVVPVTVANVSQAEVSLAGLVMTMDYGDAATPAEPIMSASDAIPAVAAPGEALVIEVVFTLPVEGREQVRVIVDSGAGSRAAVFEGQAPAS